MSKKTLKELGYDNWESYYWHIVIRHGEDVHEAKERYMELGTMERRLCLKHLAAEAYQKTDGDAYDTLQTLLTVVR